MKKGSLLIVILLIPSLVYMLFSLGQHNTSRLGYFGKMEGINDSGDTIYKPITIPELLDQNGQLFDNNLDQVTVLHLFAYPCEERCADNITTLNNYLTRVEMKAEWNIMSVCTTQVEQSELKSLAEKRIYFGENWQFYRLAKQNFAGELIDIFAYNPKQDSNAEYIALLDQNRQIRAFFNVRTQQDNKILQDAIKLLIQEPHISWKQKK